MSDTEEDEVQNKTIKIAVVGEPSTGKSTLCAMYLGVDIPTARGARAGSGGTAGAEVMAGQCVGLRPPLALQLCDVSGASRTSSMLDNYLYGSDIVLFVYDLTNLQSFERLPLWLTTVREIFETESKKPLMALFGNKSDLEHQRAVRLGCVQKLSSENLLESFKGSARTGDMVNMAFTSLISRVAGGSVRPLPTNTNSKSPLVHSAEFTNGLSAIPRSVDPAHSLIMTRKALRKMQRKESSSVCCIQ